ncbi:MAG: hypothetical protein ACXV5P_09075 [Halobacteriota archaeon]
MASYGDGAHAQAHAYEAHAYDVASHANDVALYDGDAHACSAGDVAVHRRGAHRINRVADTPVSCFLDEEVDEEKHVHGDALQKHDAAALQAIGVQKQLRMQR